MTSHARPSTTGFGWNAICLAGAPGGVDRMVAFYSELLGFDASSTDGEM